MKKIGKSFLSLQDSASFSQKHCSRETFSRGLIRNEELKNRRRLYNQTANFYVFRTPVVDRSSNDQFSSNLRSQISSSRIVVSVDRRPRDSNEDLTRNHRTSLPIRPSHPPPMNAGASNDYIDSFSIDAIPQETYNMLSRFPEFRRLVKAYNNEEKKCQTWAKDFARLQNNYKQLEENSFRMMTSFLFIPLHRLFSLTLARPPPSGMNYLVDLVSLIQRSSGRGDPRNDEQIARALGENSIFLMGLKNETPQQTALNLFNHLYPGYESKLKLGSVRKMEKIRPGLLETILSKHLRINVFL